MKTTMDQLTASFKWNNNSRKGQHWNFENKHAQIHWNAARMAGTLRYEPHTEQTPLGSQTAPSSLTFSFHDARLCIPPGKPHWGLYSTELSEQHRLVLNTQPIPELAYAPNNCFVYSLNCKIVQSFRSIKMKGLIISIHTHCAINVTRLRQ